MFVFIVSMFVFICFNDNNRSKNTSLPMKKTNLKKMMKSEVIVFTSGSNRKFKKRLFNMSYKN